MIFGFPPVAPSLSLAELFGPVAVLAMIAVGVVMSVLVVGLALDGRTVSRRATARPPIVSRRHARPAV
jgi:hypothetical protein